MTTSWLYVSLKNPAFCYKDLMHLDKFRDYANEADKNISEKEKSERVFMFYLISKNLENYNGDLPKKLIGSATKIDVNPNVKLHFGQMFVNGDKIAVIDKECELRGIVVEGKPLGRGFSAEIKDINYADSLVNLIDNYPDYAKIERWDKGRVLKIIPISK